MSKDLDIRLAEVADLKQIQEIVCDAVEGMNKAGNYQWSKEYPTQPVFEKDIELGDLYVAADDAEIVGVVAINQNHTEEYDELEWKTSKNYYGVHRLAVSKKARGRSVAFHLMQQAEFVAKSNDCLHLRIDTNSMNPKAQALFLKLGYVYTGQVYFSKTKSPFFCYEKILQ